MTAARLPGRMPPDCETFERRCAALEAENQALRDRLEFIELTVFGAELMFPPEWRLTPQQTRLLGVVTSMRVAHRDAIMTALYGADPDDAPNMKAINVLMVYLRRKLKPLGIEIRSVVGFGYAIDEPQRSHLRRACHASEHAARRRFDDDGACSAAAPASHLSPSRPARTANPGGA